MIWLLEWVAGRGGVASIGFGGARPESTRDEVALSAIQNLVSDIRKSDLAVSVKWEHPWPVKVPVMQLKSRLLPQLRSFRRLPA